jgi:hypothetical protein
MGLRQISVDRLKQKMILHSEGYVTAQEINFIDISKILILKSNYHSKNRVIWNYTLVVLKKNGEEIKLCASDDEVNIFKVHDCLEKLVDLS